MYAGNQQANMPDGTTRRTVYRKDKYGNEITQIKYHDAALFHDGLANRDQRRDA